jgi:hypothetical protein
VGRQGARRAISRNGQPTDPATRDHDHLWVLICPRAHSSRQTYRKRWPTPCRSAAERAHPSEAAVRHVKHVAIRNPAYGGVSEGEMVPLPNGLDGTHQARTRADERHCAEQHVEQVWQIIEREVAQEHLGPGSLTACFTRRSSVANPNLTTNWHSRVGRSRHAGNRFLGASDRQR